MSVNLPNHYVQQYASTIELLLQQKDSRFEGTVRSGSHVGKQASPVDQIGAIEMQPVSGRFNPINRVDAPTDRRWCFPEDFDLAQLIDHFDELRLLNDPKSSYVQNSIQAAMRKKDDLIIDAFFADAKTGETGATTTSFPAGQQVAVNFQSASNVGLTVAKLREAKRLLMANEVDFDSETVSFAVTAKQHDDLLAETQIISKDFNDRPVLVDGRIREFLGMRLVVSERLDTDGSSYRRIPVWAQSGMYLGMWGGVTTDISQRKDLSSHPWQSYLYMTMGATRLEEEKVVEIKCNES